MEALMTAGAAMLGAPELRFLAELPEYAPERRVGGTISLWGHGSFKHRFMPALVGAWYERFTRHHPGVELDYRMYGTASAIGALYTGAGNLAILGEEISPAAARAFRRARGYPPTGVEIATGSLETDFFDYAHMIFVHRGNPVRGLSLPQLDAVFGAENLRSPHPIRTWDGLGLTGEWAGRRIRPHGWRTDVDFALFFSERVLGYSHRWNSDIREYVHIQRADGSQYDHGRQILDALAGDHSGIAISNIRYQRPEVRVVPLSWSDGGRYVHPTVASLISQEYPLTRLIPAYVDRPPGEPLAPLLREFLRLVLSREGQRDLVRHSGYLPLGPAIRVRELTKLDRRP
jgi:phosphate transport system substrate-binding protein